MFEVLARILRTTSQLLHDSAMRRDQVCPSSNKARCFITHPLFTIYKPDPLAYIAHLSPPPSRRLSMSMFGPVVSEQRQNESIGALTCSGGENLGTFSLNVVYILSLQTSFERVADYGFHQRFTAMRMDQVCTVFDVL